MRRVASSRFRKTLELARNVVNITFPAEFGVPVLFKTSEGVAAMFPDHVAMRALIDDQIMVLNPVGEGVDAQSAVIDLFSFFAAQETYQDILVRDPVLQSHTAFAAYESPYSTIIFQKLRATQAIARF